MNKYMPIVVGSRVDDRRDDNKKGFICQCSGRSSARLVAYLLSTFQTATFPLVTFQPRILYISTRPARHN